MKLIDKFSELVCNLSPGRWILLLVGAAIGHAAWDGWKAATGDYRHFTNVIGGELVVQKSTGRIVFRPDKGRPRDVGYWITDATQNTVYENWKHPTRRVIWETQRARDGVRETMIVDRPSQMAPAPQVRQNAPAEKTGRHVTRFTTCSLCGGSGRNFADRSLRCGRCGGYGSTDELVWEPN